MKKRLNILCLLVMLVFCYSVFESAYYISSAFVDGFRAGMNYVDNKEQFQKTNNMKSIALFPDNFANLKDSVYNEKTGEFVWQTGCECEYTCQYLAEVYHHDV